MGSSYKRIKAFILSIVLFLSMDSVVTNLFNVSSTEYKEMNYNLIVRAKNDDKEDTQKYFKQILELQQVVENTRMNAILKYDFVNIDKSYFTEEHLKNYIGEAGETGKRAGDFSGYGLHAFHWKYRGR